MTADRERHLVELVDEAGTPLGARTVDEAHRPPGQLHRAFSVLLVDPEGRTLLQQRAAVKTRFPLRWANACCGHPEPGQSLDVAAGRRLREELGVEAVPLTEIGVHLYRAEDPGTGRVEYEYDHVLLGDFDAGRAVLPDPDEVADLRWVHPDELRAGLDADPDAYAPWLAGVLGRLTERSRSSAGGAARRAGNRGRWKQPPAPTGQEEDNPAEWSGGR
ncbi:isopentenyl-diphosphate Delta-isomerase [Plantactinospora sp. WMMB782]|uniref:isopentenyl-diphosphate Delta-isomerase n=1 Tax=Plantactinospora sp. WMMB782 TaxID=3404121 RepID=UPI003B9337AB